MMRNIAIGLAAATIAIGSSALSASAGQERGISKGMSRSAQPEHGRGGARELADFTPLQRAHLRRIAGQLADRERIMAITGGRYAELTGLQRARLRRITRQLADLTPL